MNVAIIRGRPPTAPHAPYAPYAGNLGNNIGGVYNVEISNPKQYKV